MASAAIDTLATYEAIAAAGIDDRGARAISKAIADSIATYREDLATKADVTASSVAVKADITALETKLETRIAALETKLETRIAALEAKLETRIAALEAKLDARIAELRELIASTQNRTIVWNFGMLVTFAGIIVAAIKLL